MSGYPDSGLVEVVIRHKNANMAGVLSFDGRVLEAFGFTRESPVRFHVRLIESAELVMGRPMPHLKVVGRSGGILGFVQMFDPSPSEQAELEVLAAALTEAAAGYEEEA